MANTGFDWGSIVPKAAIGAVLVYGSINWLFIGPEVATRVAAADHIPVCIANFQTLAQEAGDAKVAAVPPPKTDETAIGAITGYQADLNSNWAFQSLEADLGALGLTDFFGINRSIEGAKRGLEQERQAAINAYKQAINSIKEQTATELGRSGDVCGCVADAAISETRNDWALFTASLGVYRSDAVRAFDETMLNQYARGYCANVGKVL